MMSAKHITPVLKLFFKYKECYDIENKLMQPDDHSSTPDLWQMFEYQLQTNRDTVKQQIANICQVEAWFTKLEPPLELVKLIPKKVADKFDLAPASIENGTAVIATANPLNPEMQETLKFILGSNFRLVVEAPTTIEVAIAEAYGAKNKKHTHFDMGDGNEEQQNQDVPKLARYLVRKALEKNATDLHMQPFTGGYVIRIRVDGQLQRMTIVPDNVGEALTRVFKIYGAMDPTLTLIPQDGRSLIEIGGQPIDMRISTLPVAGNMEKLVVRLLKRQSIYNLSSIGFSHSEIHTIQRMASSPSGVVLVCGPTGSGKTTTLYSILNGLNQEDTSIMTVENPVEYQMNGLSQTEINEKAGMTFPKALRAILRQDPDVILIGEIRDEETAQIAMQSALTGHLVFSTLHTNDSLSAIPRLMDLGIKPIILSESLTGIISQRLVRKLCEHCKQPMKGDADLAAKAFESVTHTQQANQATGCSHCDYSGYSGRTVIAELVEINQEQRELLMSGQENIQPFRDAMKGKFNSLSMSASRLVISGITTAMEATRVLGQQFWTDLANEYQNELPDLAGISGKMATGADKALSSVLVTGDLGDVTTGLITQMEASWLNVYRADSPSSAEAMLKAHEDISLVFVEISDNHSEQELIDLVADYRAHMAWSRLPALLRIPKNHNEYETILKEHGSTSRFVTTSESDEEVVQIISHAISGHTDFKWGLTKPDSD